MTKEEFITNFSFEDDENEDDEEQGPSSFVREPKNPIKPRPFDTIKLSEIHEDKLELVSCK